MLGETVVLLAITFFQVVGAFTLLARRGPDERPVRLLAALLFLNATLSAISAVRSAGRQSLALNAFESFVDLPTAALFVAFFFARSGFAWRGRAILITLAAGAAQLGLAIAFPALGTEYYVPYVAYPYYASIALAVVACARGAAWERWVALALLPRIYYFVTQAVFNVSSTGAGHGFGIIQNHVGVYLLGAAGAVGLWFLARDASIVPRPALVFGLLVGPAMATAQALFPNLVDSTNAILSFVSLGVARPLFTYVGLVPDEMPAILQRTALGTGVAGAVAGLAPLALGYPRDFSAVLGLGAGLLALAAWDAWRSATSARAPVVSPGPVDPAPPADRVPQWQRLLVELRGSSERPGPGRLAWTQKELSRRTGISVQRVSEFPATMNASAVQKLDAAIPGWRAECPPGVPTLVEVQKGAVEGVPGVRVYYRLTPWGERLASTIVLTDSAGSAPEIAPSARIPGGA